MNNQLLKLCAIKTIRARIINNVNNVTEVIMKKENKNHLIF